jgi:hypothetical protein
MAFRVWRQFIYALSEGFVWAVREPLWWWQATKGVGTCMAERKPIPWKIYYAWMKLAREPVLERAALEKKIDSALEK